MGSFIEDPPSLYRFNVQEIPKDKHFGSQGIAQGSGIVEVRCFINSKCPFVKVKKEETVLVFNFDTITAINEALSSDVKNVLQATPGTEGMHFIPRYVYRNNYIQHILEKKGGKWSDLRFEQGNFNFQELVLWNLPGEIVGADQTKYRDEQTWFVMRSVFDDYIENKIKNTQYTGINVIDKLFINLCFPTVRWKYNDLKKVSTATELDLFHDYTYDYYQNNRDEIDPNRVQMPEQIASQDCTGDGIHWRLMKKTPLYRGEDFFIEFHKRSKSTDVNKKDKNPIPFAGNMSFYHPLDVSLDPALPQNSIDVSGDGLFVPANNGVVPNIPTKEKEYNYDFKKFDFSDQAYYIIELGHMDPYENYFIIICERADPICIRIIDKDPGYKYSSFSKVLGDPYTGISGAQLLNADFFKMTVRNHLGALVIEFDLKDMRLEPWVIRRSDEEYVSTGGGEPLINNLDVNMIVPRGYMTLWGGNMLCGFIFGPLQYSQSYATFEYPPRPVTAHTEYSQGLGSPEKTYVVTSDKASPIPQSFSLPIDVRHYFRFTASDQDIEGITKFMSIPNEASASQKLFTQDSQFYLEYPGSKKKQVWANSVKYGSFFYGPTVKELAYIDIDNWYEVRYQGIKDSFLVVYKYRKAKDKTNKLEHFTLWIGMQVGDHLFDTSKDPSVYENYGRKFREYKEYASSGYMQFLKPTEWILSNCKTPIMTNLRLVSVEDSDPRWKDGTSGNYDYYQGVPKLPNPYFIDASDHVMEYSDSWTASDFSSIEHTGTIKFLLNEQIQSAELQGSGLFGFNEVTDALLNFQNKTFYIEVWAGYQNCDYTKLNGFYKLFTGLCHGGEIEYSYSRRFMTCKIFDYTKILKDQLIFNSPFFDGVRDCNAINEFLTLGGFRSNGWFDPAYLLSQMTFNSSFVDQNQHWHLDGRIFLINPYVLPSAYGKLQQPAFKFTDGTSYYDCISQMATRSGKVFYFDQHGIAHYEDFRDIVQKVALGEADFISFFDFTSNPDYYPGQLVFEKVDQSFNVGDVYNHLKLISTTPDHEFMVADHLSWDSFDNPAVEGFIGYLKPFLQQEGMFGSEEAIKNILNYYTIMFRPPINTSFETYGLPIRALDIVKIDGLSTRVMTVNHSINPAENRWWMNLECERFLPINQMAF